MENSLRDMDRLTHFMWASVVLGSYFTNVGRLTEAYAVIGACARFAFACGLDGMTVLNRASPADCPLLSPPASEAEAKDRILLSRAIYMADRSLSMLSGLPSVYRTVYQRSLKPNEVVSSAVDEALHQEADDVLNVRNHYHVYYIRS